VFDAYHNLDEAWTSKVLRGQWLQLPLQAVERLLGSDGLLAWSENVLYVVLASWLASRLK
jgi:hypothetical protein